jgi:hypothetical protein
MSSNSPQDLKAALESLVESQKVAGNLQKTQSSFEKGALKELPKDIVRVQTYVITTQGKAIEILLSALKSRDSIQERLGAYLELMGDITQSYKTAEEAIRQSYSTALKGIQDELNATKKVIVTQQETIEALEKKIRVLDEDILTSQVERIVTQGDRGS